MKKLIQTISYNAKVGHYKFLSLIFKIIPIDDKKIVFINLHSNQFKGNNKIIYKKMLEWDLNFNYIIIGLDDIKMINMNIFKRIIKSIKFNYQISTARYIILNDYYSLFSMIKIRKGTELIQVWHAGGAFKKFGKDSLRNIENKKLLRRNTKGHSQYTKVIVSSKKVVDIYANALSISPNKIYPIGIPRADVFFDTEKIENIKQRLLKKYTLLLNKKIILYAPTFRDNDRKRSSLGLDLGYLSENLEQDYIIVLKMHPFERGKIKVDGELSSKVLDLSHEEINDLLIIADLLITDYSSLIFEYAILQRPMIFFAYDLEKYENDIRGFYYPYTDFVPGPIAYTTEEVVEYIKKDEWDFKRIKEFAIRFNEHFDGRATERFINDVLFEGQENCQKVGETV